MAGVRAVLGFDDPRVLAWGPGRQEERQVCVVAVEEALVLVGADRAEAVAWHEIVQGGWDKPSARLHWQFLDGTGGQVVLDTAGELPRVFNDRVNSSIVAREVVQVGGGRVLLAGRRRGGRLGRQDPSILWTALAKGDADLTDPDTEALVVERTQALRQEWEGVDGATPSR